MDTAMDDLILRLATERGQGKTICPSEAARAAAAPGEEWRRLMPLVRRTAVDLARQGRLLILRKGKPVDPETFKGIYRLTIPHGNGSSTE
jgi:hypothetical protein